MISTSVKILWALLFVELYIHNGDAGTVKIGAFFGDDSSYGDVFGTVIRDGINRVRNNRTLLPEPHSMTFVDGNTKPVNAVYTAIEEVCAMINSERPSALIVLDDKCPDCSDLAGIMSHGSNPVFSVDVGSFEGGSKAFKMYPSAEDMSSFYIDILHYFKWRAFTLLVDSGDAFANFEGVMQEVKANDWNVTVIPIDHEDLAGTLEKTTTAKSKNIFLYCVQEMVCRDVLDKGIELNNMDEPSGSLNSQYTWILGNLDLSLPEQYKDSLEDTNAYITYFTMNFTRELQYTKPTSNPQYDSIYSFPMREKLAFDAVLAIGHALGRFVERRALQGQRGDAVLPGDTQMLTCPTAVDVAAPNDLTLELIGDMPPIALVPGETAQKQRVNFEGMTGNVAFDENGNRVNYTITIFSGRGDTLRQLRGEWTQNPEYLEDRRDAEWENEGRLNTTAFRIAKDRKIRIVSIEVPPFLYLRDKLVLSNNDRERYANYRYRRQSSSQSQYTGNGRFEGYIMELLIRISDVIRGIDFEYEVELVPDGNFGASGDFSEIWDGMIGEVVRGAADVAAGPLTVTDDRKSVVDFTYPFMSSGIQVLVQHPNEVQHNPFRIVYPFSIEVWFLSLFVFGLVTIMLFVFNRLDPYEWKAQAEKQRTDEANASNFNLKNSLWFCASTLFLQSYSSSPRSNAGRCIAGFWWLYVLFMVFLYLTNLNFFVTSNQRLLYLKDVDDLLGQLDVQFGTAEDGNTNHYLENNLPEVWHEMNNDPNDVYVSDLREGVERVRSSNGKYAYIGETPELTWIAKQKPCNLLVAGEYLARTQYAFAVAKGSPLADHISGAIETLRDNGVMEDLHRDWWKLDDRNNYCSNLTQFERSGAYSMTVNDLSGAYYILVVGIFASLATFLVEYLYWKVSGGERKHGGGGGYQTPKAKKPKKDFNGVGAGDHGDGPSGGRNATNNPNMWI